MLALWTELDRHQFGRSLAHAATDVVAMDDEHVAAIVSAVHDQMDVRIVSVPVINSDPIQPRTEVVLHLLDEVTGKGWKVLHLGCVFGTDDEPEMMPVITGALGKATQIRVVRNCVEHAADAPSLVTPSRLRYERCARTAPAARNPVGRCGLSRSPGAHGYRTAVALRHATQLLRRGRGPRGYSRPRIVQASSGRHGLQAVPRRGPGRRRALRPVPGS